MNTQNIETESTTPSISEGTMSTQKKALVIGTVILVGLYLVQTFIFSPERMAERMIERATDGAYDVSLTTSGDYTVTGEDGSKITVNQEDGTYEVSGSDGEQITMTSGTSAKLPDSWPPSIPVPDGVTISYVATAPGDADTTVATVQYSTDESVASILALYKNGLNTNGWTEEATLNTPTGFMLTATRDEKAHTVTVYVTSDGGQTQVTLSTQ